jgi:transposase
MRYALNAIAKESPEWLNQIFQEEWQHRYYPRGGNVRVPHSVAKRQELAEAVGRDAYALLDAFYNWSDLSADKKIEAVEILRRVVIQQFYVDGNGFHWRTEVEGTPPSIIFINSPYDLEARYGKKRNLQWTGYKIYLTETCDEELPRLITNVETSSAPVADFYLTEPIHQSLEKKGLLPAVHLADTGFVDAELMLAAKNQYQIDLLGPSHLDRQWQSRNNPQFCAENFLIDWGRKKALCPAGKTSSSWSDAKTETAKQVVKIKFSTKDCQMCSFRADCTKSKRARRTLTILPEVQYESQRKIREREKTEEYRKEYQRRSGIEGTISQAVRGFGIRRSRYIGQAKTHFQQVISATAINFVRKSNWKRTCGANLC